jgi:hypothetical protein
MRDTFAGGTGLNGHNINGRPSPAELAKIVAERANQARESFIGLYLEATGASIEDTVLCEQHDNGVIRWWCEPKGLRK